MSKLKKLLPKRDLRARWLWVLALALTAVKLGLCSFQLIVASPDLSPIDDTLMFNLAKSISAGNWLGEYDWLTLGKHSFYALWLAFLNLLHVNIVVGGQALFAVNCLVLLAALKPVMRTNWGRLFVFAVTLYTPASWAENTLRVYRDNIYPSLVLLALAGLLGAFTRFREKTAARAALLCCSRPFPCGGLAVPRGQRAAAAVRSVRGGGLSCLSVSGQKHCAQKEPPGAAAGTISAVGRRHRGLVRHELQVLWPFYHQRFHFQRIQ